jgi:hypothetical protein
MSTKRKKFAQVQMVERGLLTMFGCKDKLCLEAEIKLVEANRPKMLSAYNYKLCPEAERRLVELGHHKLLKVYKYELDVENQKLMAHNNHPKMLSAYRFELCDEAKEYLPKKHKKAKKNVKSSLISKVAV